MDEPSQRSFLKALALFVFLWTINDAEANLQCGPYPPAHKLSTNPVQHIPVDQKVDLSAAYGYCWIYMNVGIANIKGILQCKEPNWGQLTLNSGSKAKKLAEFGKAGRASFEADLTFKRVYDGLALSTSIYKYTSDLICLNTIEYDVKQKIHVWSHNKQPVNFQAFDPTDVVYKGNSCASFNITSEKWRFDPWCMDICTPVCQQEGHSYPNELPDILPIVTPPNFQPPECQGEFTEKTPTLKSVERYAAENMWNKDIVPSSIDFYGAKPFGYLFPSGYGYCWIFHIEFYQVKKGENGYEWINCTNYYPNSKMVAVNTKEKVQKLYDYGKGMRFHLGLANLPMDTARLSEISYPGIWKSTGQRVNWTSFGNQGHDEDKARTRLFCPMMDFREERWYESTPHYSCGMRSIICQQQGMSYPDETPDTQGFTAWSEWSSCSSSCGEGIQFQTRQCHGSYVCTGDSKQQRSCQAEKSCEVNGGFTPWAAWGNCTEPCGPGSRSRSRSCTNPTPQFGGADCVGNSIEAETCEVKPCKVDGGYTEWSAWGTCSVSCGAGTQRRSRDCTNPAPKNGGAECPDADEEKQVCETQACPIDGGFTDWSSWTTCSVTCGPGKQARARDCTNPAPQSGGAVCEGPNNETRVCNSTICPVDGGFSEWSSWGACSVTCDEGSRRRLRDCNNPAPLHGGKSCSGELEETEKCTLKICAIDGGFSKWSKWSKCSATCGLGTKIRERDCTNPAPSHGGRVCDGDTRESQECQKRQCPLRNCRRNVFRYFGGRCLSVSNAKYSPKGATFPCTYRRAHRAVITSEEDANIVRGFVHSIKWAKDFYFLSPFKVKENGDVIWASTRQNAAYVVNQLDIPKTKESLESIVPIITPRGHLRTCDKDSADCIGRTLCQQRDWVYYGQPDHESNEYYYD